MTTGVTPGASVARHVVVGGAGMAGLVAAVSAAESGADVVVVEKAERLGGTARLSGGLIWTFQDLGEMHARVDEGNPLLQELVHADLESGRRWLADHGVDLQPEETVFGYGWGQRMDPEQGLEALANALADAGGRIETRTALDGLVTERGCVVGVRTRDPHGVVTELSADAVVLATGGFHGNPELVSRYIAPAENLYVRASAWSTGDGLLAATAAGAALTRGMSTFYGHALAGPPAPRREHDFRESSQIYGQQCVALNMRGERFADETLGTGEEDLNQALARQPEGRGFYVVDAALADAESRPGRRRTRVIIDWARDQGSPVVEASTLAELAEGLGVFGVPPDVARVTLEEVARATADGTAHRLSPPRSGDRLPLGQGPFFAVGVKAAITFTMGGIAIDDETRVVARSGSSSSMAQSITDARDFREVPIPGLYAAGCDVGNVSHRGYVGGLSVALTTGRVAGRNAAAGD